MKSQSKYKFPVLTLIWVLVPWYWQGRAINRARNMYRK